MYSVECHILSIVSQYTLIYLIVRYICSVECQYACQLDFNISYSHVHIYSVECQYVRQLDFNISYSQVHTYSVCQYAR